MFSRMLSMRKPSSFAKVTIYLMAEYTDLKNAEEAEEIINLANYLRFDILEEAIMAALAVNYFVGNNEK